MLTFEEFKKTIFYTRLYVRLPLLNIVLEKTDFIGKKGFDNDKLNSKLLEIYDNNKQKLK